MMQTVNIRALKDKLSSYLQCVQHGDVLLISDRGRVVAEMRSVTLSAVAIDTQGMRVARLVETGALRRGLANAPEVYAPASHRMKDEAIDAALAAVRTESLER